MDDGDFDVVVVANQGNYPLLETIDITMSRIFGLIDRGIPPLLILTNPDLFYPKSKTMYGITAGSVALIIEESLKARYGKENAPTFHRLGKPFAPIFEEVKRRVGTDSLVMIGDQIETDIKGAIGSGIDSAFFSGGVLELRI